MVVGDRQVQTVEHFSPTKKLLQRLGSWVVRRASGTKVPDTTSGFRAYNREAALQLIVVSRYTYTLESLIQAGKMSVAIEDVPIAPNPTDARVAARRLDLGLRAAERLRDLPRLHALRAAARLHDRSPSSSAILALAAWSPVPARLDPERRPQRPHPVADPRRGADAGRGADVRPRDHRRRPRRPAGDPAAGLRAGAPAGARGRRQPSNYEPGDAAAARSRWRRSRPASPGERRRRPPTPAATSTTSTGPPTRSSGG